MTAAPRRGFGGTASATIADSFDTPCRECGHTYGQHLVNGCGCGNHDSEATAYSACKCTGYQATRLTLKPVWRVPGEDRA